jgi:hypothetical protein
VPTENVVVDAPAKRVLVRAAALPGADLSTYRALEARVAGSAAGWSINLVPPLLPLPELKIEDGKPDAEAVQTAIWAAQRLGLPVEVTGRGDDAETVADMLRGAGVGVTSAPDGRSGVTLRWLLPDAAGEPK